MDCSLPGSSVHGILQARILEWVAIPFSRGSSRPRDRTCVSYVSLHWQAGSLPLAPLGNPFSYGGNATGVGWWQSVKCAKNTVSRVSKLGPRLAFMERTGPLCFSCLQFSWGDETDTYKILTSSKNQDMNQNQMMVQWLSRRSERGPSGGAGDLQWLSGQARTPLSLEGWMVTRWRTGMLGGGAAWAKTRGLEWTKPAGAAVTKWGRLG